MNWKHEAVEKLKVYGAKQVGIFNIADEIREASYRSKSIRSSTVDGTPVKGGGSGREEMLLNNMMLQDELKENLQATQRWVKRVERGLAVLSSEERTILERFYISAEKGAAYRLAEELRIDVKTVYHRKDQALQRFTFAMYGRAES